MGTEKTGQGVSPTGRWHAEQREHRSLRVHRAANTSWAPLVPFQRTLRPSGLDQAAQSRWSGQSGVPSRD